MSGIRKSITPLPIIICPMEMSSVIRLPINARYSKVELRIPSVMPSFSSLIRRSSSYRLPNMWNRQSYFKPMSKYT